MKIIKYIVLIVTISLATNLYAQKNWYYKYNLNSYKEFFKDTLGINIVFPKKFNSLDVYSVGFKVSKDPKKDTGSAYGTFFLSKDKNCIIAFPFCLFGFTSTIPKEKKTTVINTFSFTPKNQVTSEIKTVLDIYYHPFWSENDTNKNVSFDLYKYADFIFGRQAREKYNADAYSISDLANTGKFKFFGLQGQSLEKLSQIDKYPYCTSLFIQRDERVIDIKFFFTKKGFKKKEKYIKMLDKHIWFDENFKPN